MDKSLINSRFLEAINLLISNKIAKNKAEISSNLGISASKFSEILNERMLAGVDLFAKISEIYNVSADWLLTGRGDMIKQSNIGHNTTGDNSPITGNIEIQNCKSELDIANMKISYLEKIIKDKEEMIELLKQNGNRS